jgi:NADPH-dependent glutamate synthase beta subunit-like oxidoreductase
MTRDEDSPSQVVAIIGGAVAGAEAAKAFSERGIGVVVFEQNSRPFGKIEDGLPRWHQKLRNKEYGRIKERLNHPLVEFVPLTTIGRDLTYDDLVDDWGFSAVMLANGAWRDRSLPIEGVDEYLNKGLYYQNAFIYWFNHHPEKDFKGPHYAAESGTIVVGGGLASIDVVKALMLETIWDALEARGVDIGMDQEAFEHKGFAKVLEQHGLTLEELGVEPCTLYYRRRPKDMPLVEYRPGATDEQKEKTHNARQKVLNLAMTKFLFKFQGTSRPVGKIVEDGRLVGIRFLRTRIEGRKVIDIPGTEYDAYGPLTISSIGSIPAPLEGVPMKGELYVWEDWDEAILDKERGVFGLGNVITGKGNINVSRRHGRDTAIRVAEQYIGVGDEGVGSGTTLDAVGEALAESAGQAADAVQKIMPLLPEEVRAALYLKVGARQKAVGYSGDLLAWLDEVTPDDMI